MRLYDNHSSYNRKTIMFHLSSQEKCCDLKAANTVHFFSETVHKSQQIAC